MGRNKKSEKGLISKSNNPKTVVFLKVFCVVISPILYELLVYGMSKMSLGTMWEDMLNANLNLTTVWDFLGNDFWSYGSLILSRIIVYTLPAIVFFMLSLTIKENRKNKPKTFLKCLNLQFLGYLIYQGITIMLALDYLIGLEPFSNIGIFMAMFGYIATLYRKKEIEFGKVINNNYDEWILLKKQEIKKQSL